MSSVDSKVRMLSRLIILWSTRESSKIETRVAGGGGGGGGAGGGGAGGWGER